MCFSPVALAAEPEFFVEIGNDVAKADVDAEWDKLRSKHKSLLGKLKLYPKDVFQGGKNVASRMQAGPIPQKTAALRICNKLFAADVPCFVIEAAGEMPPTAMMNMNGSNAVVASDGKLPWLQSKAEVAEAPKVKEEESSFFSLPWLSDKKEEETKQAERKRPAENVEAEEQETAEAKKKAEEKAKREKEIAELKEKVSKREASVQVAEAIRVPLSDESKLPPSGGIAVSALPDLMPSYGVPRSADGAEDTGSADSGAGWLVVENLLNEEVATSLWDEVRSSGGKKAKTLQAKVEQGASKEEKAVLNIGPFASSADAYSFCREGLQARDRGLRCNFKVNDAGFANKTLATLKTPRADAYEARRTSEERRRPAQNPQNAMAQLSPSAGTPANQYWVQVASAGSQIEALKKWEDVKAEHGEVLGGLRSSVSASATDNSQYVVRVGPIVNNDDAIRVCSQLQKRQVQCRVLLYSTGG